MDAEDPSKDQIGQSALACGIERLLDGLPVERLEKVCEGLRIIASTQQSKINYCTFCTGVHIVGLVFRMMTLIFRSKYGVDLEFEEDFACEILPEKQKWLKEHFQPPRIFHDMMEVAALARAGLTQKAYDVVSEAKLRVPMSPVIISGFQCDQVSGLNTAGRGAANTGAGAVASGEGVTGSTARALLDYMFAVLKVFLFGIAENTKNLHAKSKETGESNLDTIIKLANEKGICVRAMLLNATMFACPQHRPRWYIVFYRVSVRALTVDSARSPAFLDSLQATVEAVRLTSMMPLETFLLPETDKKIVQFRAEEEAKYRKRCEAKDPLLKKAKGEGSRSS